MGTLSSASNQYFVVLDAVRRRLVFCLGKNSGVSRARGLMDDCRTLAQTISSLDVKILSAMF